MYRKAVMTLFLAVILAACTNIKDGNVQYNDHSTEKTRPIHYDSNNNQNRKIDNNPADYSDAFTNEESIMLTNKLEAQEEIVQAQVASTDDRVIVSLQLNKNKDHNITQQLKPEIQKLIPDKQIVIYTDDPHWERMKNIDSKLKAKNIGNDIEDFFNKKDKKGKKD